jgi:hypothetical protein
MGVARRGAHFACKATARKRQIREFLATVAGRYRRPIFAQKAAGKSEGNGPDQAAKSAQVSFW